MMAIDHTYPPVNAVAAALRGRCPRCGHGKLFKGFIGLQPCCCVCKMDYAFVDSGDGPAVFMSLLAGFVVVGLLLWTEVKYEPAIWILMAIFMPMTLVV